MKQIATEKAPAALGPYSQAQITGNLRFVCGMTAGEAEEMTAPGDRMPLGVVGITIVTPG